MEIIPIIIKFFFILFPFWAALNLFQTASKACFRRNAKTAFYIFKIKIRLKNHHLQKNIQTRRFTLPKRENSRRNTTSLHLQISLKIVTIRLIDNGNPTGLMRCIFCKNVTNTEDMFILFYFLLLYFCNRKKR